MVTQAALDLQTLPDDPETLKRLVRQLAGDVGARDQQIAEHEQQIQLLRHYLALLRRHRFGRRSEKLTEGQLLLELAVAIQEPPKTPAPPKPPSSKPAEPKKGHGRRMIPADLLRLPLVHEPPAEAMHCAACRKPLSKIGQESCEQLEYEPAKLYVIQHIRPKYACDDCEANVVIADPQTAPIDKALPGAGLLAKVLVDKYADHLPLYRQAKIWGRQQVWIPESTLCGWVGRAAELLAPITEAIKQDVLASKVIKTDDTPIRVLDPAIEDKIRTGRLWPYVGDRAHPQVFFEYTPSREEKWPERFFNGYRGYLQGDFYPGYENICADGKIKQLGCWAHARRRFYDAQTTDQERALVALTYIGKLYDVEREAKDLSAADRQRRRQHQSRPILDDLKAWMEAQMVLPESPIAGAMRYVLGGWEALTRYVDDGDLSIDNNECERDIRPVAIGRKNWLFAGSDEGGRRAAILYTLVLSCRKSGVNPFEYLRDVLLRVSRHPASRVAELMPRNWKPPPPLPDPPDPAASPP